MDLFYLKAKDRGIYVMCSTIKRVLCGAFFVLFSFGVAYADDVVALDYQADLAKVYEILSREPVDSSVAVGVASAENVSRFDAALAAIDAGVPVVGGPSAYAICAKALAIDRPVNVT